MSIFIGTSGYSYDDWRGTFYPKGLRKSDMLPFYAGRFPAVEINSTYYRIPSASAMQEMGMRVPEGFQFAVKAHQDMTHSGRFDPEAFRCFRRAMEPLREMGMLGCVLAQFPWSFKRTLEHEIFLEQVRAELPDAPVVIEFRNAEWIDPEVFELLRGLGLGYCCVDEPRIKGLIPPLAQATSSTAYVRFHGRNGKAWLQHQEAYERYDYLYSAKELAEWIPKIQALRKEAEQTFIFFNNHYLGKAGQNARQMAKLLNVPLPLDLITSDSPALGPPTLPGLGPLRGLELS